MKHYKDNDGNVYGFLPNDVDVVEMTDAEFHEHCNPAPTKEQLDAQKVSEAKAYLASSDFYFTVDKYATLTEERKAELKYKREDARTLINLLEVTDE